MDHALKAHRQLADRARARRWRGPMKCLAGVRIADMGWLCCAAAEHSKFGPCRIKRKSRALLPSCATQDRAVRLTPAAVAPHPLLGGLAHPGLELLLHFRGDPAHVVGRVGRARNLQLLELDLETGSPCRRAGSATSRCARPTRRAIMAGMVDGFAPAGRKRARECRCGRADRTRARAGRPGARSP